MKHEFSLAHLTDIECPPAEMVYIAAKAGYDYVSLRLIPMDIPGEKKFLPQDKQMINKLKAALDATGVGFLDLELARIIPGKDYADYVPAMEMAAELGAKHVISSAWFFGSDEQNHIIDGYARICRLAQPFGLTVELEFPSFSSVANLQEAVTVIRAADAPNCGLLLDTLYFHMSHVTLKQLQELPQEWFHFLHICDTVAEVPESNEEKKRIARENRLYIGEGCIDFQSIFNQYPSIPYSIEMPHAQRLKELGYEEYARRCIESAKQYINSHQVSQASAIA